MNYQTFNIDVESAKKADREGGRISQTGKYIGVIDRFEFITARSGTQGVEIFFKDENNLEASMILYTFKSDGTPIFGRDKVNALMACAGVRTLTPTEKSIEKYDFDAGAKIWQPAVVAPELEGKQIGVLIQMEEYLNGNGELKTKPTLVSTFQASTGLMAKEILDRKTQPEQLAKAYDRLMKMGDKKLQGQPAQQQNTSYKNDDLDSDLPF